MRKILLPLLLLSVGLYSCKKEKEDLSEIAKGNQFFPTEIGKYIVYDYDSTIWNDQLGVPLPYKGQLRYTVVDTFRDAAGRLSYRINVERRKNDTDPYMPNDVLSVTPTENRVELMQRGLTFIKMVFPVASSPSWNGNALIALGDKDNAEYDNDKWKYTYANFDNEFDPGNNLYEHTVTVNQIDDQLNDPDVDSTAYAYRNYSQEVYAYNVGLVYRERIYWEFQPKVGGSGGSGFKKGYSVVLRAVENN
ncbi:hypothetical protein [Taibaiella koreensis]|uniref:hypothetical protein n=1 Tax=Taibaiella koreensis TaxID=1268548 RepID=UPI000E599D8D|nr:hypothetical protein [Taibaiella koreensis]